MESSHPDRQVLRRRLIAAREALPASEREKRETALLQHLQKLLDRLDNAGAPAHATLGFCWPFRSEPDLRPLITRWLAADPARRAALPHVVSQHAPLVFRCWTPDSIVAPDRYGIQTPVDGALVQASLLLIPLNGFDARGYRLGYGGGYFDRTLESLEPTPTTIGVGFELGRLPRITEGAHDRPLDWIVTELGSFPAERG